jgi:hypothetical protein
VQFIGAQPDIDTVAFWRRIGSSPGMPEEGPGLKLAGSDPAPGDSVTLLSFPLALDLELRLDQSSGPAVDRGFVSQVSPTGNYAASTLSSGGLGQIC